jgi:hypothetical protein
MSTDVAIDRVSSPGRPDRFAFKIRPRGGRWRTVGRFASLAVARAAMNAFCLKSAAAVEAAAKPAARRAVRRAAK